MMARYLNLVFISEFRDRELDLHLRGRQGHIQQTTIHYAQLVLSV